MGVYGNSILSLPFFCKSKTVAPKTIVYFKKDKGFDSRHSERNEGDE